MPPPASGQAAATAARGPARTSSRMGLHVTVTGPPSAIPPEDDIPVVPLLTELPLDVPVVLVPLVAVPLVPEEVDVEPGRVVALPEELPLDVAPVELLVVEPLEDPVDEPAEVEVPPLLPEHPRARATVMPITHRVHRGLLCIGWFAMFAPHRERNERYFPAKHREGTKCPGQVPPGQVPPATCRALGW